MSTLLKITKDHYLKCEKPNNIFFKSDYFCGLGPFQVPVVRGIPWELAQHVKKKLKHGV